MQPKFQSLNYPAKSVATVRLTEAGEPALIVANCAADGKLALLRLPLNNKTNALDGPPISITVMEIRTNWDIALREKPIWRLLSYYPGSGTAPLYTITPDNQEENWVDPRSDNFGIFMYPRFVRHAKALPPVTAVDLNRDHQIVYFPVTDDGASYSVPHILSAPVSGIIQDARVVSLNNGYWLLTKRLAAAQYRRLLLQDEKLEQNTGLIEAIRLDASFKPVGEVWKPFGDEETYEFDADQASGHLAVFASMPNAWRLVTLNADATGGFKPTQFEGQVQVPIISPSILATNTGLMLSMLLNPGTDQAQISLAHAGYVP